MGFDDSTDVRVFALSAKGLSPLFDADTGGVTNGDLNTVAWSPDGVHLIAGGRYDEGGISPALVWAEGGCGARSAIPARHNTLMGLAPLPQGGLLIAAQDPWLGRIDTAGKSVWSVAPPLADFSGQHFTLALSADGARISFGYEFLGQDPAWFDVTTLQLTRGKAEGLEPPDQTRLKVTDWMNSPRPQLSGRPLELAQHETSRAVAVHPDGAHIVLGAPWPLL